MPLMHNVIADCEREENRRSMLPDVTANVPGNVFGIVHGRWHLESESG
jgi:hypothetical protein